jgi:putative hydrolase of the HAD superfamily
VKYQHLFFDLDRTLWDFERNSSETINELFHEAGLSIDKDLFTKVYQETNKRLWESYGLNLITKEVLRRDRFRISFEACELEDKTVIDFFSEKYIERSPKKTNLVPFTNEVLENLSKKYTLHIITNGFEEVQHVKLAACGIDKFFSHVVTSERAGAKKPDPAIFDFTCRLSGAQKDACLMIGDSYEADILGAKASGIDAIYFNRDDARVSGVKSIQCLSELLTIL